MIHLIATGGTIAGAGTAPGDAASAAYRSAVVSADELLAAVPGLQRLAALQAEQLQIHLSDASLDYLLALVQQSRFDADLPQPLSPRAAQTLLAVSRAWALVAGRRFVSVEDVQAVFPYVAEHRLRGSFGVQRGEACPLSQRLLARVDPDRP